MLLWCFAVCYCQADNLELYARLIDSRVHRNGSLLAEGDVPDAALDAVTMTYGQNGDLRFLDKITVQLANPQHQAAALLAYGEVDGAPLAPLLALADKVAAANAPLLAEALAKLARPADAPELARLWSGFPEALKNDALFYFWRQPGEELSQKVIAGATGKQRPGEGYLYYLYRARVLLPAQQLAAILSRPDLSLAATLYASRIRVTEETEGRESLAASLTSLTTHQDWRVRVNVVNGLGALGGEACIAAAGRLLGDGNPNVVAAAAVVLVGLKREDTDALLFKANLSPAQEKAVMGALDGARAQRFYARVADWGTSADAWKRAQWIQYQGKVSDEGAIPRLHKMTESDSVVERALAFNALRARKDPGVAAMIKPFLYSGEIHQMAAAVDALRDFKGSDPLPFPLQGLHRMASKAYDHPDFHFSYLDALAEIATPDVYKAEVTRLCQHPDYLVRLRALSLEDSPDDALRKSVMTRGWDHDIPPEVRAMALGYLVRGEKKRWSIETKKGRVTIELRADAAPITVANIVALSGRGYFDDMAIHRVVPNFVVQAGDPRGDGSGGPGYAIPCEINDLRYRRGSVGMALSGKDTGGSQFFIAHTDLPHLDGGYTVFGNVLEGMEVVDKLEEGDRIVRALILD